MKKIHSFNEINRIEAGRVENNSSFLFSFFESKSPKLNSFHDLVDSLKLFGIILMIIFYTNKSICCSTAYAMTLYFQLINEKNDDIEDKVIS